MSLLTYATELRNRKDRADPARVAASGLMIDAAPPAPPRIGEAFLVAGLRRAKSAGPQTVPGRVPALLAIPFTTASFWITRLCCASAWPKGCLTKYAEPKRLGLLSTIV